MYKSIVHIFGASGSGTSTLGKFISEQLGYTFMDIDDISGFQQTRNTLIKEKKIIGFVKDFNI